MILVSPAIVPIGSFPRLASSSFPSHLHRGERRTTTTTRRRTPIAKSQTKMEMWVFGYGSLIWKAGFNYDDRLVGFVKNYRRVFYQGSTDHRGTPDFPGRTVTLEPADGEICWGVAYKICSKEDRDSALDHLEVREKQYDEKAYLDFFTDPAAAAPAISGVMVYIGSADKERNQNYLGSAPLDDIAKQIARARGPSGPNTEYLFKLEAALLHIGCKDEHVMDLASKVREILSES
ncbi:Gamma-glutamylcyclotransferase 2-3 [Linum perenne]